MRKRYLAGLLCLSAAATATTAALGAPITPGDVVLYRVGDGAAGLANTGGAVFVDEYTPGGSLVQSIALPTTASGSQKQLVASGTATSEGLLTVSPNGQYVAITGYASNIPAGSSLSGTTAATVNRVVGIIPVSTGSPDTSTALTDYADANNPRSAVTSNGTDIWVTGGSGGIRYTTFGSTTSTQLSTTVTNLRQANIFGGQLLTSTGSGSAVRVGTVGTGLPTTAGQTITNIPGFTTSGSPYAYFFADLDAGTAGVDTLYVASDDAAALTKYSLVGGNWTSNGVIGVAADAYRGVTGTVDALGNVQLFATRKGGSGAAGGGELVSLLDSSGYNGAFAGSPTLLATAGANTAFRGVGLIPAVPEPATLGLLSIAGLLAIRRRAK